MNEMTTTTQTEPRVGSVEYFEKMLDYGSDLSPDLIRLMQAQLALRLIENRVGDGEPMAEIRAILTAYRKVTGGAVTLTEVGAGE